MTSTPPNTAAEMQIACAKIVCSWCRNDWPLNRFGHHYDPDRDPLYRTEQCAAAAIRAIPLPADGDEVGWQSDDETVRGCIGIIAQFGYDEELTSDQAAVNVALSAAMAKLRTFIRADDTAALAIRPALVSREAIARELAGWFGPEFDNLHRDKRHWSETGGMFADEYRDVNAARQDDLLAAADAILALLDGDGR